MPKQDDLPRSRGQALTEYVLILALGVLVLFPLITRFVQDLNMAGDKFIDKLIFRLSLEMQEFHFPGAFTHF